MVICLDFDGVMADTGVNKRMWISANLHLDLTGISCSRSVLESIVGPATYRAMQSEIGYADTLGAPPVLGALEVLRRMSGTTAFHLISARPPQKMKWVSGWMEEFGLHGVIRSMHSSFGATKAMIADSLGAEWLVDDDPRHLQNLCGHTNGVLFGAVADPANRRVVSVRDWLTLESTLSMSHSISDELS